MGNVLAELFQDIADSIKAKTGIDEKMKPLSFPERIQAMDVASGADEINLMLDEINGEIINGKLVTFVGLDGSVLCQVSVVPGFNCANPVTTKLISAPTKESTVDLVFTFSGWSLVEGGEADADALKKVTEDRTVYAAFTSGPRYYTVTFYDDMNALLHTARVAYGGSYAFSHDKTGARFKGWNPEPANITGDLVCYGIWEYAAFTTDSWEQIAEAARTGKASEFYNIGDEREIIIQHPSGWETIVVEVAAFNQETDEYGNFVPSITIVSKNPIAESNMEMVVVADEDYDWNKRYYDGGFPESSVYQYLTETILPRLPEELQTAMKAWPKTYSAQNSVGRAYGVSCGMHTKIWIPSTKEVLGDSATIEIFGKGVYSSVNTQEERIRRLYSSGLAVEWWLRTSDGGDYVCVVFEDGNVGTRQATHGGSRYVVFAFALG